MTAPSKNRRRRQRRLRQKDATRPFWIIEWPNGKSAPRRVRYLTALPQWT